MLTRVSYLTNCVIKVFFYLLFVRVQMVPAWFIPYIQNEGSYDDDDGDALTEQ